MDSKCLNGQMEVCASPHRAGSLRLRAIALFGIHHLTQVWCSTLSDFGSQCRVLLSNGFVVLHDLLQVSHSFITILCLNLWKAFQFINLQMLVNKNIETTNYVLKPDLYLLHVV